MSSTLKQKEKYNGSEHLDNTSCPYEDFEFIIVKIGKLQQVFFPIHPTSR